MSKLDIECILIKYKNERNQAAFAAPWTGPPNIILSKALLAQKRDIAGQQAHGQPNSHVAASRQTRQVNLRPRFGGINLTGQVRMTLNSGNLASQIAPPAAEGAGSCSLYAELQLLRELVERCEADIQAGRIRRLPGNAAFLTDGRVLCRERERGDSRYPYGSDGFNFWVSASGKMHGNRGLYYLFLPPKDGQEPRITFFAGCRPPRSDSFVSHALLPLPYVSDGEARVVDRYTVVGHDAIYFVARTPEIESAVRVFVEQARPEHIHLNFSVLVQNRSSQPLEIFTSAYMNPFCRHQFVETTEDCWFKKVTRFPVPTLAGIQREAAGDRSVVLPSFAITTNEDVDRFRSITNFAVVRRAACLRNTSTGQQLSISVNTDQASRSRRGENELDLVLHAQECTSRIGYLGSPRRDLASASFLKTGRLERDVHLTVFNENAIVGDLLQLNLPVDSYLRTDYVVSIPESHEVFELELERPWKPINAGSWPRECA